MAYKIVLFFTSFFWIYLSGVVYAADPIVYSRCVRNTTTLELNGDVTINGQVQAVVRLMRGLDTYDVLPDVTNFFGDFTAPCDLVLRQPDGVEEVIYNCSATSTSTNACAALDPAVSFDAKEISFSVFRGTLRQRKENISKKALHPKAESGNLGWTDTKTRTLKTKGAHIHIYNIETKQTRSMPYAEGTWDAGPAYLPNGRIAFTSNRMGNTTTIVYRKIKSRMGSAIWTMDADFKNIDLASHHSLAREEHPFMLKDGRLAYSSWQIFGGKPFKHTNGIVGGATTLDNLFQIYTQSPDGANNFAFYGQHSGTGGGSSFGAPHLAAHFITQTSDERVWFADYYRANNKGLGNIIGVMPEPEGQEGINPHVVRNVGDMYLPRDVINFAKWAQGGDVASKLMKPPALVHQNYADPLPWAGKVGHPAALPNNGLMLSWGKGVCSLVTSNEVLGKLGFEKPYPPVTHGHGGGSGMNVITLTGLDTPGCDVGVYRATKIPSNHPSDLEMIVDSPDWHEIMARAVVPYSAIHGVEKPRVIERADRLVNHPELPKGTPFGLLGSASITDRETHPRDGIKFVGERQFNLQGTDTINYNDEALCGVRMIGVMPNRSYNTGKETANIAGERLAILGEVPVKHVDAHGNRIIDPSGHPDASFLLSMPANVPYIMQGIDCEGRTLNTDQTWQHLRPGEMKTCGGCHVHSKPSRITFDQSFASKPEYQIPKLGRGAVPLIDGTSVSGYGMQVEFTRDIKPIFDEHCVSCHKGDNPAGGLPLDLTGTKNNVQGTTWWRLVSDYKQAYSGANKKLRRPQLTRYVRAFNALGSLLYWKAANQRTDSYTDSDREGDIDFGVDHPTTITSQQLGLLSRWIDLGNPGGEKELLDTQNPTIHLAANVENEKIKSLLVGIADLGRGVDPSTLKVSVDGQTLNGFQPVADAVNVIPLPTDISDLGAVVVASVKDAQGNKMRVERTVAYLLDKHTPQDDKADAVAGNTAQPMVMLINKESDRHRVKKLREISPAGLPVQEQIIVDNSNLIQTKSSGQWLLSSSVGAYGKNSSYSRSSGDNYTWFPNIDTGGDYKVYARWTYYNNRSTLVSYAVHHANGGVEETTINQKDKSLSSQWHLLGTYKLDRNSRVVMSNIDNDGTISADAIKFDRVK